MTPEPVAFMVEKNRPHQRLDAFLRSRFPDISRSLIQRLIEHGDILVDGRPVKPTHAPMAGERVEVRWPEPIAAAAQPQEIPLEILFEDEDLLVVNKPPGMVVHPSAGHDAHTLVNALLHHCRGRLSGIAGVARPGIVHRLDKETSGCLVVAKNDTAHLSLSRQFAERQVQKVYQALVCGQLSRSEGEIRAAIARHPSHRKRMAVTDGSGRDAWTTYRVLESLGAAALVEVRLHSGRTHQIRVHFQYLGCPLVGDAVYGKRQNKRLTELTGYTALRQMLHACELAFTHPRSGTMLRLRSPLPDDFTQALARLRSS